MFQGGLRAYQQGDLTSAIAKTRESLEIREKLYLGAQYHQGHPEVAVALNNLGIFLGHQGLRGQARECLERALAMRGLLYPKERYPWGHPDLAASLNNLGGLLQGPRIERRGPGVL